MAEKPLLRVEEPRPLPLKRPWPDTSKLVHGARPIPSKVPLSELDNAAREPRPLPLKGRVDGAED